MTRAVKRPRTHTEDYLSGGNDSDSRGEIVGNVACRCRGNIRLQLRNMYYIYVYMYTHTHTHTHTYIYLEAGQNYREEWFRNIYYYKRGYLEAIPLGLRFHLKSIARSSIVTISNLISVICYYNYSFQTLI